MCFSTSKYGSFSSISSLLTAVKSKIASSGITISLTDAGLELKSPTSITFSKEDVYVSYSV